MTGRYFEPCPVATHRYKIFRYGTYEVSRASLSEVTGSEKERPGSGLALTR